MDTSPPLPTSPKNKRRTKTKELITHLQTRWCPEQSRLPKSSLIPHNYTNFRAVWMTHIFTKEWLELIQNISIRNSQELKAMIFLILYIIRELQCLIYAGKFWKTPIQEHSIQTFWKTRHFGSSMHIPDSSPWDSQTVNSTTNTQIYNHDQAASCRTQPNHSCKFQTNILSQVKQNPDPWMSWNNWHHDSQTSTRRPVSSVMNR